MHWVYITWRSGYCYLNKGECNLNQSKEDSFVERVAKNNSWNNGDRHKIHEIYQLSLFPGNSPCFSWLNIETFWPLCYLETFFPQITKIVCIGDFHCIWCYEESVGGETCIRVSLWVYWGIKSVQSALSDLKRPLNIYSPSAIIGLSLLDSILMARFLKQSFAQTCLKETDNGKLQQFNYSRSLITNRGTVERGIGRIAKNYYASLGRET